jgi:hypothetical protein
MSDRRPGDNAASQRERILSWALAGHILHQDLWWPGPGADGGPGIRAVRSRIPELEAAGYGFDHTRRFDRTIEYRLAYVPERPAVAARAPVVDSVSEVKDVEEPQRLFEPVPAPALNAALTDWNAA